MPDPALVGGWRETAVSICVSVPNADFRGRPVLKCFSFYFCFLLVVVCLLFVVGGGGGGVDVSLFFSQDILSPGLPLSPDDLWMTVF